MGVRDEMSQIGGGLGGVGEGLSDLKSRFTGWFDPAQKAARAEVRDAQKAANAEIAAARGEVAVAQAQATADAVKAQAAKTVEAIKSGAQQAAASEAKAWTFGRIASKPFRVAGTILGAPFKWSAKFGAGTVDAVAGVGLKPVKWVSNGVGGAFRSRPGVSLAVTAGAAAVAAGSWFANRGSKNLQAQSDAIQQMQMAQAMPQGMYMNNPEASQAFVDARMAADRDNSVAGASSSRADAVMAARQQAPNATADVSAI